MKANSKLIYQLITYRDYADKISKTIRFYARRILKEYRGRIHALVKPTFSGSIFIVGCSRSGTTLVYKTLSLANELASLQRETHAFWNALHPPAENNWSDHRLDASQATDDEQRRVSRYFFQFLGDHRFVDKANQNGFRIGYLDALFPDARFVFVKRDGPDNINSLIQGWGRPDEYGDWSVDLPESISIDQGRFSRWCFFLYPGWREDINASIEDVCARQWIAINEAILDAKAQIPARRWVEASYEDLLRDPATAFRQIFEALDLSFDHHLKSHCDTVISRPYNAFSQPRLNKWREEANAERIENVLPRIASMRERLGYPC